ncbi:MAG: hypothetical protein G3M70_03775 [Candidatus Nitronauta litoralis]|uniref:Uncharacterized protein n=1 Tax=Candidatus Nitronauta litoralis TaxID=2705533 RepID=A0A7T0FZ82_9BACT|nr:MAG: hypothetical protein G3M70_03775 [Candidatus Nitronauta litoralis]
MMTRIVNLLKLYQALKTRGNWPLIRRSARQLLDFVLCQGSLNRKNPINALIYWWGLLKGYDLLVWRLETFGFLFLEDCSEQDKEQLNRLLPPSQSIA